jgi:hypothetical protein
LLIKQVVRETLKENQVTVKDVKQAVVEAFHKIMKPEPVIRVPNYQFSSSEGWEFRFAGRRMIPNENLLGFFYIQHLLKYPHEIMYSGELEKAASEQRLSRSAISCKEIDDDEVVFCEGVSNHDDVLDREAREQYRKRLEDLAAQRRKAREQHDLASEKKIDDEYQVIENELSNAKTIHGKTRNIDSSSRNLSKRVTKNINTAIERIEAGLPDFAQYLRNSLYLGLYPFYAPHKKIDWHF